MISVLLVDDQPLVRQGLRMRMELEPDLLVVGEAGSGLEAVDVAWAHKPDVVVMDVEMGAKGTFGAPGATQPPRATNMDGIAATARLREVAPRTRVVMLTIHGDAATRARAQAAGAVAFVEKQASVEDLLAEIRRAKRGPEDPGDRKEAQG